MSKKIADELTELMVGVVTGGTGTAGAIPEAQVAGKTGTAELGPKPGQENEENPIQIKDAWFAAFAPAEKPRLAVGVLLIEAEAAGGEVAAPAAAASALGRPLAGRRAGLEVERDLAVLPVGAGDVQDQRAVLGGLVGQQEEHQRALDRALLRGRVEHRNLFLRFDLAAEREGVEAFAGQRLEVLVVGVAIVSVVGQRLRLFGLVLDFEEDAEVGGARRRLAPGRPGRRSPRCRSG